MRKELKGLRWKPSWVSHLGSIYGCLEYLGADITRAWLYGGTGHAFIINVHEVVCPSGPTAWDYRPLVHGLGQNLGYKVSGVSAVKSDETDFETKQNEAWDHVRGCIDLGIPCYGWELDIPEFYTVHGYDDVGYYYSGPGCDEGAGPKPWQEVGDTSIGSLEMFSVERCDPASDEKVIKDAFSVALNHAEATDGWIFPGYASGPAAFDLWAAALENGCADRFGQGYNAAVWAECRGEAVAFLNEAKERLAGKADSLFDEALLAYTDVHTKLKAVHDLHPFPGEGELKKLKSLEAAALIRNAGAADKKGLEVFRRILKAV